MRIVIDGNDGLGKTTLIEALKVFGYEAQDRGLPTKMTDDKTLKPDSDEFYIILDAPVSVSQERLKKAGRSLDEEYHTQEDLEYYRKQFIEVVNTLGEQAALVDASGTPEEVLESCLSAIEEKQHSS